MLQAVAVTQVYKVSRSTPGESRIKHGCAGGRVNGAGACVLCGVLRLGWCVLVLGLGWGVLVRVCESKCVRVGVFFGVWVSRCVAQDLGRRATSTPSSSTVLERRDRAALGWGWNACNVADVGLEELGPRVQVVKVSMLPTHACGPHRLRDTP